MANRISDVAPVTSRKTPTDRLCCKLAVQTRLLLFFAQTATFIHFVTRTDIMVPVIPVMLRIPLLINPSLGLRVPFWLGRWLRHTAMVSWTRSTQGFREADVRLANGR
jgi:hypothetical protein